MNVCICRCCVTTRCRPGSSVTCTLDRERDVNACTDITQYLWTHSAWLETNFMLAALHHTKLKLSGSCWPASPKYAIMASCQQDHVVCRSQTEIPETKQSIDFIRYFNSRTTKRHGGVEAVIRSYAASTVSNPQHSDRQQQQLLWSTAYFQRWSHVNNSY
jgi:hypothetical protein